MLYLLPMLLMSPKEPTQAEQGQSIIDWVYSQCPELICQNSHCDNGHFPFPSGEDGTDVEWGACPECIQQGKEPREIVTLHFLWKILDEETLARLVGAYGFDDYVEHHVGFDEEKALWDFSKPDSLAVQLEDNPALVDLLYPLVQS